MLIVSVVLLSSLSGGIDIFGSHADIASARVPADSLDQSTIRTNGGDILPQLIEDANATLTSETTYWQGQTLYFDGSTIIENPASASAADRTFQLRRVRNSNEIGGLVSEFVVDANGERIIRTESFTGEFVILYKGAVVHIQDGTGYTESLPGGGGVTVANSQWEVTVQTLRVEWSDTSISRDEESTLEINSNRAQFILRVSAAGLDFEDLERIFPSSSYADDHDVLADDDIIRLLVSGDDEIIGDFEDIDSGVYPFRFEVPDSTARSGAAAGVATTSGSLSFDDSRATVAAGDIASFNISFRGTAVAYLVLGSAETNVFEIVEVNDRNRDGTVRVHMNTRYIGLNPTDPGGPRGVRAFRAESGSIRVYQGSDRVADGRTLTRIRELLDVDANGLERPLQPGLYNLVVATSDSVSVSRGDVVVNDERDTGVLSLTTPTVQDIQVLVAPRGSATTQLGTISLQTARETIAIGDRVVVRIRMTGVFGYLDAVGTTVNALVENPNEGIDLRVEQVIASPNQQNRRITLDQSSVRLVSVPGSHSIFVVLDTANLETNRAIRDGQSVRIRMDVTGIDRDIRQYNVKSANPVAYQGYPYLPPGSERGLESSFEFTTRQIDFAGLDDDEIYLPNIADVAVSGTTNLAPGTEFTVRLRGTGDSPFLQSQPATVDSSGAWTAPFDLSEQSPGDEFTASVVYRGSTLESVDGILIEQSTPTPTSSPSPTETETPTPESSPETETPITLPSPELPPDTPSPSPTAVTQTPGQPGFGILVTILAVIAILGYRVRRLN